MCFRMFNVLKLFEKSLHLNHLLLFGGVQRLGSLLGLLLADANETLVGSGASQRVVGGELLLFGRGHARLLLLQRLRVVHNRENGTRDLLGGGQLVDIRLFLAHLLGVQREEDQPVLEKIC